MLGIGQFGPRGPGDSSPAAGNATEREAWVVLASVVGVGPVTFDRLVRSCGSAATVLAAAREPGAVSKLIAASRDDDGRPLLSQAGARTVIAAARDPVPALRRLETLGISVVTLADDAYPARLRSIELPPPLLFARGEISALSRTASIAVVGTRRPSELGRRTASRIAMALAAVDATVVSGLALGIDGAAHAATIERDGITIAVLGGGHERLYPAGHRRLAERIVETGGAVISEFPPDCEPTRGTFPRRNRIISGLSDATVVVEAGAKSGALTTAAWALEQGRRLFLVPGSIEAPQVAGCLAFLRELAPEARIVAGVPELLEDLGLVPVRGTSRATVPGRQVRQETRVRRRRTGGAGAEAALVEVGATERLVGRSIARGVTTVDGLVAATGVPSGAVLSAVTALELRGLVADVFGHYRPLGPLADPDLRIRTTAGVTRRVRREIDGVDAA